ncbi:MULTISPECIES: hypothetical protein [Aphanizomenon]|jgi:hypothetical protein|uniref:hypothetical protein n=1 Tax=Aphanizomenon TaxID=1175 RepID=UPI000543D511|nr:MULTISPECIES: hypothetical protein [Aphanizomenon]KHG39419.1 hypothetical protein OA07_23785 [Aphanizomenon flos-aquae 2012/KM1/D3]MTJ32013.1 hypothetical protein [Aphanizomenon sp. UHCC 0183]QSV69914.1 MAG: hypothetical protein HEQ20_03070 [Aphanizomenon flos-aquae KM1D3_PB]
MKQYPVGRAKQAFLQALRKINNENMLSEQEIGKIIDKTIKLLFEDLMKHFHMKPNQDYVPVSQLPDNAKVTDFVFVSENAQEILEGLFEGKIEIVQAHLRRDKHGNYISVPAYLRSKSLDLSEINTQNKFKKLIEIE